MLIKFIKKSDLWLTKSKLPKEVDNIYISPKGVLNVVYKGRLQTLPLTKEEFNCAKKVGIVWESFLLAHHAWHNPTKWGQTDETIKHRKKINDG